MNFADHWRSFYREARRRGWPADVIISATPSADRTDVPPDHFAPIPRVNRGVITARVPKLRGSFDRAAPAGMFFVFVSKRAGRLQGSFVGLLTAPGDDEPLPDLGLIPPEPAGPSVTG